MAVASFSTSKRAPKTGVLIVDDQPVVRRALTDLIAAQPDLTICGQADDAVPAFELITTTQPDLVITGLSLKHCHGLEFVKDLHVRFPRLKVLVFSMFNEAVYAERAIRAGARGFIHKHETMQELLHAIRQVLSGEIYLSNKVAATAMGRFFGRAALEPDSSLRQLSDRELEVLQLIGHGRSTREIAAALHVDVKTVETYRARIKTKLNLSSATELVDHARRWVETKSAARA